jgi:hypothetical protein
MSALKLAVKTYFMHLCINPSVSVKVHRLYMKLRTNYCPFKRDRYFMNKLIFITQRQALVFIEDGHSLPSRAEHTNMWMCASHLHVS